jgi:hypothetical protein
MVVYAVVCQCGVALKCTLLQISCSLDSIVTQDVCGHPEPTSKFFNSSNNMECRMILMILIIFSLYPF